MDQTRGMGGGRVEGDLLLAAARARLDDAAAAHLRGLLAAPLDWGYLLELATRHQVLPLLARSLERVGAEAPEGWQRTLTEQARTVARENMLLTRELLRLLAALEAEGIDCMPYKGPLLAQRSYGDPALRQFFDLDILIHKRDFARARALLVACGYEPDGASVVDSDQQHLRKHHDYPFVHRHSGVAVELQWGLMQLPFAFPPAFERWWRRSREYRLGGRRLRSLGEEDMLLALCMHGSKHLWQKLIWVCDMAETLRNIPLDWERLASQAREARCERMLRLGLLLASDLLQAPLPAPLLQAARGDADALALAAQVRADLFRLGEERYVERTPFFYLRMMDRRRDRVALCIYCYPSLLQPQRLWREYGARPLRYLLGIQR